jgi:hypothetical protein
MTASAITSVVPNRVGLRDRQVSELTVIAPLKQGGAGRLRVVLDAQGQTLCPGRSRGDGPRYAVCHFRQ